MMMSERINSTPMDELLSLRDSIATSLASFETKKPLIEQINRRLFPREEGCIIEDGEYKGSEIFVVEEEA